MSRLLPDIKRDERRGVIAAFCTIFFMLAALALLETARDALFLARLPASRLAFVYLAIAALALPMSRVHRGVSRRTLSSLLGGSALVTLGMWVLIGRDRSVWLYVLYIWTGFYATLVVTELWTVLGARYTLAQAKRLYGTIGAGSVIGAVAGSVVAHAVAVSTSTRHILLAAAAVLVAAAAASLVLPRHPSDRRKVGPPLSILGDVRSVFAHPYLRRVAGLVLLSSGTLTLLDFLFKSVVAAQVPPRGLAPFFANFQIAMNVLSFLTQVTLVGWILRTAGVGRMLIVLPALLALFAGGVAASGALIAVLLLKGADGAMRYSLHRTAIELLFVPVPNRLRDIAKAFIDATGQRVGQALASLVILALAAVSASPQAVAVVVAAISIAWLVAGVRFRGPYLELFRQAVREGSIDTRAGLPRFDRAALETLVTALDSQRDAEVLAALDLLDAQNQDRLVPTRILDHPSRDVVLRALDLFTAGRRADVVPLADHLLEHPDPEIRAAALRVRVAMAPDVPVLRAKVDDKSARVSAIARVGLVVAAGEESARLLRPVLDSGDVDALRALARAIRERPGAAFHDALLELGRADDVEVRLDAARAMAAAPRPDYLPVLLDMLAVRTLQEAVREAMRAIGGEALSFLERALADQGLAHVVRAALPRCLSVFVTPAAGAILLRRFLDETDGAVRFQILRTLGRMRRDTPELLLDHALLDQALPRTVTAIYRLRHWRVSLEAEPLRTPLFELLVATLRDKERHGIERLFRLLGLRFASEEFEPIYVAARSGDSDLHAGSVELIENVLEPPLRDAVAGIVDADPEPERLERARGFYEARPMSRAETLEAILDSGGETLQALAAYQVGMLGLTHLRERLEELTRRGRYLPEVARRALDMLARRDPDEVAYAG